MFNVWIRRESHIDFCTQCVIMTLVSGEGKGITNDALKFRKLSNLKNHVL